VFAKLLVMPYAGVSPAFASPPSHSGAGAAVLGRVTVGRDAWFGAGAVVRADGHYVTIGDDFRLGARGTVHIAHDVHPTHIGDGVTAGVNSIIHACDVGNRSYIGRDVVILDGSKIGEATALADGAVVFPRSSLEGGWLYAGQPAKPVRKLEPGELDALHAATRAAPDEAGAPASRLHVEATGHLFVALTARLSGRIVAGPDVGVWFGCDLDAGRHVILIGESTNIQDNTIIRCEQGSVEIGRESTIGHNVLMTDCKIGDHSLIGMGSTIAAGTQVEGDVLVAAGAHTAPGQVLESGWLYGGRPARQLSRLDGKRGIITGTWPVYAMYARKFQDEQMASRTS
jgi:gamma-carbonic anhydrase